MRFAAMKDPCDDWLVYDLISALPTEIDGRLLIGLKRSEAEQFVDKVNAGVVEQSADSPAQLPRVA